MKVFVVGASVDMQNPAQGFYIMLEAEFMYSVQSLAECGVKMAIAFFNIRFSSSSWALRF